MMRQRPLKHVAVGRGAGDTWARCCRMRWVAGGWGRAGCGTTSRAGSKRGGVAWCERGNGQTQKETGYLGAKTSCRAQGSSLETPRICMLLPATSSLQLVLKTREMQGPGVLR